MNIEEAAMEFQKSGKGSAMADNVIWSQGALSDTAKQYWFEQFEQVACEFAKWHETLSLEQLVNLPTEDNSPYPTFNDAFKYFIDSIYKKDKQKV